MYIDYFQNINTVSNFKTRYQRKNEQLYFDVVNFQVLSVEVYPPAPKVTTLVSATTLTTLRYTRIIKESRVLKLN